MARRKKKKLNKLFLLFIAVVFVLIYHYYDRIETQYSFIDNKIERYNRDDWGKWADDDNDGLNTRNEVLLEESLIKPLISNNKIVNSRKRILFDIRAFCS